MPTLTFPSLADEVLVLRPWVQVDVDQQLAAFADPLFATYSDWAPRSREQAGERIIAQEQARLRGEQVDFAVVDADDPEMLLGGASLNGVSPRDHRASLGYWLTPAARGRGVASRAVRLIAGWAFQTLGLARLEITCGPDNHGSRRVAERCGFSYEGRLRSHQTFKGGRRDTLVFGLLPGELI